MQKLSRVHLRTDFDPTSEDSQFSGPVLVAGSGRTKAQNGGTQDPITKEYTPNPPLRVTDVDLEDDPVSRRVWVRSPGSVRFVPYEMVRFGEPAPEDATLVASLAEAIAGSLGVIKRDSQTCATCGKVFTGAKAAQELGGHRRHCKGAA